MKIMTLYRYCYHIIWVIASYRICEVLGSNSDDIYYEELRMPGISSNTTDAYLCTTIPLNMSVDQWIIAYKPLVSADKAHHLLLFGCVDVNMEFMKAGYWDCGHHGVCNGESIMFGWAKNAPATHLPKDVGFMLGKNSGLKYLTLQIHYANPISPTERDYSGIGLTLTNKPQKYKAGIYLLMNAGAVIPPHSTGVHADMNCQLKDSIYNDNEIYLFAFRVHAHALGRVVTGYKVEQGSDGYKYTQVAKGNPKWPQAFYAMDKVYRIQPSDILHARCTWDSTRERPTYIGSTGGDEMCNLYLMYYTSLNGSSGGGCPYETFPEITKHLPVGNDEALPSNPLLEMKAKGANKNKNEEIIYENTLTGMKAPSVKKVGSKKKVLQDIEKEENMRVGKQLQSGYAVARDWDTSGLKLGQVTGVDIDTSGNVIIFHRGDRVWDGRTFQGNILVDQENPIKHSTVLKLDKNTGSVLHEFGKNMFFMPHGLAIDAKNNVWLTDVGLHQVFKFSSDFKDNMPLLTLGIRFVPGSDDSHFCKPTAVAILETGEFFVADGYCNARIIKFSANGDLLFQFGTAKSTGLVSHFQMAAPGQFSVPHSLTLASNFNEVCVGDRENGRVQCFAIIDGAFMRKFDFEEWGGRLFSAAYTPAGQRLFAVNGPELFGHRKLQVFEVDYASRSLIGAFSPNDQGLSNPHDVAVTSDAEAVYVVEIGPNVIWKFTKACGTSEGDGSETPKVLSRIDKIDYFEHPSKSWSSAGVSIVILGLLAIPVIILSVLALIIRSRNTHTRTMGLPINKKVDLGILLNKHYGFEKLSTKDVYADALDSEDSDIEEFSQIATHA